MEHVHMFVLQYSSVIGFPSKKTRSELQFLFPLAVQQTTPTKAAHRCTKMGAICMQVGLESLQFGTSTRSQQGRSFMLKLVM